MEILKYKYLKFVLKYITLSIVSYTVPKEFDEVEVRAPCRPVFHTKLPGTRKTKLGIPVLNPAVFVPLQGHVVIETGNR